MTIGAFAVAGKPAIACVSVGDTVAKGQLIAKADGAISSDVFASISGTVTEIKALDNECGRQDTFIVIKGDGSGKTQYLPPSFRPLSRTNCRESQRSGHSGSGRRGLPHCGQAETPHARGYVLNNGSECRALPHLRPQGDDRVHEEVARGARYIAKALGVSKIMIGIEKNKPDCIAAFEKFDDIQVVALRKIYPMGGEKQLIYSATGRKVGYGQLPADVGVVVNNVATCLSVCEAIEPGQARR